MISRSRTMFTTTLMELIKGGTSGFSKALVALKFTTSTTDLEAEKTLIRTCNIDPLIITWYKLCWSCLCHAGECNTENGSKKKPGILREYMTITNPDGY